VSHREATLAPRHHLHRKGQSNGSFQCAQRRSFGIPYQTFHDEELLTTIWLALASVN
jgi:hypothetical protein